jgi:hypothetical protein
MHNPVHDAITHEQSLVKSEQQVIDAACGFDRGAALIINRSNGTPIA